MKKLAFLFFAFCATTAFAQEIDFGAKAGISYAGISGDDTPEDSKIGIVAGLLGEYQFNETFGFQVEALYSSQGAKDEADGFDVDYKYSYINIPVLAKFYLGDSGFSLNAGPQLGILVSDSVEVDGEEVDTEGFLPDAETMDFSLALGASYKFMEGSSLEGFLIDARYNLGLTDIYEDVDSKNSVIQVTVGYMF